MCSERKLLYRSQFFAAQHKTQHNLACVMLYFEVGFFKLFFYCSDYIFLLCSANSYATNLSLCLLYVKVICAADCFISLNFVNIICIYSCSEYHNQYKGCNLTTKIECTTVINSKEKKNAQNLE